MNTFLNTRKITQNNQQAENQKKLILNGSLRGNIVPPMTKRSIGNEPRSESTKKVVWADQQIQFVRRTVKSVGKTKVKGGACDLSFRPPSADAKKKHRPIFIKTSITEKNVLFAA